MGHRRRRRRRRKKKKKKKKMSAGGTSGLQDNGAISPGDDISPRRTVFLRRLGSKTIDWVVPESNPAGVVYGLITIGALLAAESGLHETYPEAVGSAAIALLLYWLAHSYAEVLGRRLATHERLTGSALWRGLLHDWAIVRGAGIPLLALLIAWATGTAQTTAVEIALWSSVGSLIAFELLAGIRSRARPLELLLEVCVGIVMGLAILALRAILH
jgi:hypothetical protein